MTYRKKEDLLSYIDSLDNWGSVRKIRYKSQIFAFFKYASENDGEIFSLDDIRRLIAQTRVQRETIRMKTTQRVTRSFGKIHVRKGDQNRYRALALDNVSFAKKIGIFDIVEGKVKSSKRSKELAALIEANPSEASKAIIELILTSAYPAYVGFLVSLQNSEGSFLIPSEYCSRTKSSNLANHLHRSGFKTDPASFFTIRDLFYEFGLVNWRKNPLDGSENIFATSYLSPSLLPNKYERRLSIGSYHLHYLKHLEIGKFERVVVDKYLDYADGNWGKSVNLVDFRDIVSEELKIADSTFNKMIIELATRSVDNIVVTLSHGVIPSTTKTGYLIKAINLPVLRSGKRAEYLRVYKRSNR